MFCGKAQLPDFEWAIQLEANGAESVTIEHTAVDQEGNIYIAGTMSNSGSGGADIDFSSGNGTKILNSEDGNEFIAKYDENWNLKWAYNVENNILIKDIEISGDNHLLVSGTFVTSRDFQLGNGEFIVENDFSRDQFLAKYDDNANLVWLSTSDTDNGYIADVSYIDVDSLGFVYQFGRFAGTVDFATGDQVFELTSANQEDYYVAKYDSLGNVVFVKVIVGTDANDFGIRDFYVAPSGDILFLGTVLDTVDIDPDPLAEVNVFIEGNNSFTIRWNSNGEYLWHTSFQGEGFSRVRKAKLLSDGSVIEIGIFNEEITIDLGDSDTTFSPEPDAVNSFCIRTSSDGLNREVWQFSSEISSGFFSDPDVVFENLEVDKDDGIYIYGQYKGTVDFDPNESDTLFTSPTESNSYPRDKCIIKFSNNMEFQWFTRLSEDSFNTDLIQYDFKIDNEKSIILAAVFGEELEFPDYTFEQEFADSFNDGLLLKIQQCRYNENVVVETCNSYTFNGQLLVESGVYEENFTSSLGCDSLVSLELIIFDSQETELDVFGCDFYEWELTNSIFDEEGTYSTTLTTINGCDSIVSINVSLKNDVQSFEIVACEDYTWEETGLTYSQSGIYEANYTNSFGCDSILILNLSLFSDTTSTTIASSCDSFIWTANGQVFDESGIYETSLSTINGCDSLVTLELTILESTSSTFSEESCESFVWSLNDTEYTESGTYEHVITNNVGCDSLVILNLAILNQNINQAEIACEVFEWEVSGQLLTESGTYTESFLNTANCDSTIILDLEIINVNTDLNQEGIELSSDALNSTFQWLDCDNNFSPILGQVESEFIPLENGLYALEVTKSGCVDTSDCVLITTVGLDDNYVQKSEAIIIYPNPTRGDFTIALNESSTIQFIKCLDIRGREVKNFTVLDNRRFELSAENGVYVLLIQLENGKNISSRLVLME